jgi:MFS family permease
MSRSVPAKPGLRQAGAAFGYRNFRVFWTGAFVSNAGAWIQRVTVPFVLYHLTGSAAWVGFAAFMQFAPVVVVGPIGGSVADRFPRRRVLLVTQTLAALLSFALAGLWAAGLASEWVIIGVVVLLGVNFGINGPSWQAFVSELVPRSVLLNAVTLNSAQFNAARAVGPALAGIILATLGPGWAFFINGVSFAAVIAALLLVDVVDTVVRHPHRARPFREFVGTIRYSRTYPGIVASYLVVVALGFLGGPIVELLVVFADEVFEVGDTAYGLMGTALGVGAVLGTPLVAGRGTGIPRSRLALIAVLVYAAALVGFALAPVYWVALVALLVAGAAYLAVASTLNTTIQLQVDEAMRGRVLALYLMLLTLAMPLGSLVQGYLADVIGPRTTVAGAGMLFFVAGLVLAAATGLLGHMDDEGVTATPTTPAA